MDRNNRHLHVEDTFASGVTVDQEDAASRENEGFCASWSQITELDTNYPATRGQDPKQTVLASPHVRDEFHAFWIGRKQCAGAEIDFADRAFDGNRRGQQFLGVFRRC